jgi:hypothetical protein
MAYSTVRSVRLPAASLTAGKRVYVQSDVYGDTSFGTMRLYTHFEIRDLITFGKPGLYIHFCMCKAMRFSPISLCIHCDIYVVISVGPTGMYMYCDTFSLGLDHCVCVHASIFISFWPNNFYILFYFSVVISSGTMSLNRKSDICGIILQ